MTKKAAAEPKQDGAVEPQARPVNTVRVRILPKGEGKVYTGEYDKHTNSFPCYKKGDFVDLHPAIAREQEDNGHVEIVTE